MGFFDRIVPRRSVSVLPDDRILRYKTHRNKSQELREKHQACSLGSWEAISDVEARTGLLPPFTCELEMPEVTEAQLELMGKLNVPMLDGIYRADASALIQHALDEVPLFPDRGLPRPILQFLIDHKLLLSSWLSVSDLEDEFVETLPGLRALIKKCK
ncbi:MAG: hypothetical protein ACLUD0_07215 [Eubacterium ramulus]